MSNVQKNKKYIAHLTGSDTTCLGFKAKTIEVDSVEEAVGWCNQHSFMGGYDWSVEFLEENKNVQ